MKELTSSLRIKVKGLLFLQLGVAAAVMVWLEKPSWKVALLLGLAIWCFCRFYYFAFYVIEHYVDSGYHFSGLGSFVRYLLQTRCKD